MKGYKHVRYARGMASKIYVYSTLCLSQELIIANSYLNPELIFHLLGINSELTYIFKSLLFLKIHELYIWIDSK